MTVSPTPPEPQTPTNQDGDDKDPDSTSTSLLKNLVRKVTLALLGTLIALCIFEIVIVLYRPQAFSNPTPSLNRGQFTEPGTHRNVSSEFDVQVQVNRYGFVDKEWGAKWKNQHRIVVLGDSFVQAAQVDLSEGLGRQLETFLESNNFPTDVLSVGIPGAGTANVFEVLKERFLLLRPDTVILAFLVANDVMNNHVQLESKDDKLFYILDDGELVIQQQQRPARSNLLWEYSHAYRYIYRTVQRKSIVKEKLEKGEGVPIDLRIHEDDGDPIWEEAWFLTDKIIDKMKEFCQQRNIHFRIVLLPVEYQVSFRKAKQIKRQWPEIAGWDLNITAQHRAYATFRDPQTPVLNLHKTFSDHNDPSELYFPKDGHFSPQGHLLAAETIGQWFLDTKPNPQD